MPRERGPALDSRLALVRQAGDGRTARAVTPASRQPGAASAQLAAELALPEIRAHDSESSDRSSQSGL